MLILLWGGPESGQAADYPLELTEPGSIVPGAEFGGGHYRIVGRLPAGSPAEFIADWVAETNSQDTDRISDLEAQHDADQGEIADLKADGVTDRGTIAILEAVGIVDRGVIANLEADGIVVRDKIANLEVALISARRIGAAIGLIMALRRVSEADAFEVLRDASRITHRKLRDVAEDVLLMSRDNGLKPTRSSAADATPRSDVAAVL